MDTGTQIIYLFILAIPVACIAWTVTHEEVFKEPRNYCLRRSIRSKHLFARKFFYMLTCEYCFSHYVTAATVIVTDYQLLYNGWKGYVVGGFSIVWIANIYMSLYGRLRLGIKKETAEIDELTNGN